MRRILAIALPALTLAGCAGSTQSADIVAASFKLDRRLTQETPPAGDARPCARPVRLPPGALDAGPTERLWRRDRVALVECGKRKANVQDFYADRDARIAGAASPAPLPTVKGRMRP